MELSNNGGDTILARPSKIWPWAKEVHWCLKYYKTITKSIGYAPQPDGKTLLPKISNTYVVEYEEI